MNVTFVPEQKLFTEAEMLTLAVTEAFTVIVIEFEVAGLPVAHASDDVITQLITFPLASVFVW